MILQVYNSLQELSHSAEKMFMSMVNGSNLSVVVPGGSTPMYLFELLARKSVDWKKVTLILSDERMVPINHKASNLAIPPLPSQMLGLVLAFRNYPLLQSIYEKSSIDSQHTFF